MRNKFQDMKNYGLEVLENRNKIGFFPCTLQAKIVNNSINKHNTYYIYYTKCSMLTHNFMNVKYTKLDGCI